MAGGIERVPVGHATVIGILLCTGKNEATVRFALSSASAPVAGADYEDLPADARAALPSVEELRHAISNVSDSNV